MCQAHLNPIDASGDEASPAEAAAPVSSSKKSAGSRRCRLWELDVRAHCPVVGVCLPVPVLRRVVNKVFQGQNIDNDYDLHSGAVNECKTRTKLAESMQRELEQRYPAALRQAARLKTTEALSAWWCDVSSKDLPGSLWATLTHPRCSPALAQRVLSEVHMLQHQVGAAQRADLKRLEVLLDENSVLARELARAQQRQTQLASENTDRLAALQGQVTRLRADLITKDTQLTTLTAHLQGLEQAVPDLACRVTQSAQLQQQAERIHALERALLLSQQKSERQRRLLDAQAGEQEQRTLQQSGNANATTCTNKQQNVYLEDRAVLCVGGRTASVPLYRHIIESTGGRFFHHDGGEEESVAKLDATLAAADLVICQTGCISHDAYWRVKDHCKRTGKQCVFVENTGTTSLKRALSELQHSELQQTD